MRLRGDVVQVAGLGLGLALAGLGCSNQAGGTFDPPTTCEPVEKPCASDPSKTCTEPCDNPVGGPGGMNPENGGGGSSSASGGSGGSGGMVAVDVTGTLVQFTTPVFSETAAYLGAAHVSAVGAASKIVEADALDGSFTLGGALAGPSWLLAQETSGAGDVFSTYSYQYLDGVTPVTLPLVPVAVLDGVATQLGVDALASGQAQLVLEVADENEQVLVGVEVAGLGQTTVGYDVAPGQFSTIPASTGAQGLALLLNVPVPGSGTVTTVFMTYLDEPYEVPVALAPSTVTYARVGLDTTP